MIGVAIITEDGGAVRYNFPPEKWRGAKGRQSLITLTQDADQTASVGSTEASNGRLARRSDRPKHLRNMLVAGRHSVRLSLSTRERVPMNGFDQTGCRDFAIQLGVA